MNTTELLAKKTELRDIYKEKYNLPRRSKILVAIFCKGQKITKKIIKGLSVLPANFIILGKIEEKVEEKNIAYEEDTAVIDMLGIDAIINDGEGIKLENIMKVGVVPIIIENNYLGKILTEFHPGRVEGNAYIYIDGSHWSAYYALARYLENHKFPYDNRNLVKNVAGI